MRVETVERLTRILAPTFAACLAALIALACARVCWGETMAGDVNGDGRLSLADVATFVQWIYDRTYQPVADMNGDGKNTKLDWQPFIEALVAAEIAADRTAVRRVSLRIYLNGDCDLSGRIDEADRPAFELALSDPEAYHAAYGISAMIADMNGDGVLDEADSVLFHRAITPCTQPSE